MPTTTEQEAFSSALLEFLRATRRMRGRIGDEGELSLSQYHLLEPLIDGERLATCELALAAEVSAPTATRMLAGLEREGLVARASVLAPTGAWCTSPSPTTAARACWPSARAARPAGPRSSPR